MAAESWDNEKENFHTFILFRIASWVDPLLIKSRHQLITYFNLLASNSKTDRIESSNHNAYQRDSSYSSWFVHGANKSSYDMLSVHVMTLIIKNILVVFKTVSSRFLYTSSFKRKQSQESNRLRSGNVGDNNLELS